ncbi:putative methyltransferase [Cardiosporidium cionae]|uniref:Methyltransferase n=1 Tax=Cardiosporidium cionae TaxID=476202 RepID=A0ABQ7JAA8_9APIC|nr:putative methyltransferase [Cardiosporidium cionae]|eukprot:KAF8820931.1 putative methyltransferase [Cardiosporidium cionae]
MENMSQYGSVEYWDDRYTKDTEFFDWYQKWEGIKDLLMELGLSTDDNILVVGCGTSRLSEDMFKEGYTQITSVDNSPVCIQLMQKKFAALPKLICMSNCRNDVESMFINKVGLMSSLPISFFANKMPLFFKLCSTDKQMDCMNMNEIANEEFDAVIDKGTLDSLLCGNEFIQNIRALLNECVRVLKPSGKYFCISYGKPTTRLVHFQAEHFPWEVTFKTIKKPIVGTTSVLDEDSLCMK